MLRGFLTGTLTLIVLYVVTQTPAADKLGLASTTFSQGLKRFLSPQVAGVGNHIHAATKKPSTPASPSSTTAPPPAGIYYT